MYCPVWILKPEMAKCSRLLLASVDRDADLAGAPRSALEPDHPFAARDRGAFDFLRVWRFRAGAISVFGRFERKPGEIDRRVKSAQIMALVTEFSDAPVRGRVSHRNCMLGEMIADCEALSGTCTVRIYPSDAPGSPGLPAAVPPRRSRQA